LCSVQIHRVMTVYIVLPYLNTTYVDFHLGLISLWAFTRIYLRSTNTMVLGSRTLVSSPRFYLNRRFRSNLKSLNL
jgi:hypothetical protein